jgi:hydrogenase maturation protease
MTWNCVTDRGNSPDTIVIGLGNLLLSDDGVGIQVIRYLRQILRRASNDHADIVLEEDHRGGLRLMERLIGYRRAIIVDAIQTASCPAGTVRRLGVGQLATAHSCCSHDADLQDALDFGRKAGAPLPRNSEIDLIAVEAADCHTFCEELTPPVAGAVALAAAEVLKLLPPCQIET